MNEVFGHVYADAYDMLYRDKNYAAECDLVERLFHTYGQEVAGPVRSILDLGCGTGNHAIPLADRGYEVVGVDCSETMVAQARRKLATPLSCASVTIQQGDIRTIDLQRRFDAALMMFAVLGYQVQNADVLSALRTARRHLRPGRLLLLDVWYGPAVLYQRPSQRVKVIPTPLGQILRVSSGGLDISRHVCTVRFLLWRLEGGRLVAESEETHTMRYFFPLELKHFLECSGLALLRLGALSDFDRDPDETTWNVLVAARAV